jgi:chromosome segregation ATPase
VSKIEYDELKSLMQSPNHEINSLAEILNNIKERLEAIERRQNEILDEIHKLKHYSGKSKSISSD